MTTIILYFLSIMVPIISPEPTGLKVGDTAPHFEAKDQNGNTVNLAEQLESGKVILTFYRGAWCRYCIKQLKDYQDSLSILNNKGANLIAVTPAYEAGIKLTVDKVGVEFPLIQDKGLKIMDQFDVISDEKFAMFQEESKKTDEDITRKFVPVPAIYIIGQDRKIEYVSFNPNYRERVTMEELLRQL